MSVVAPLILTPTAGIDFRTTSTNQLISGTVENTVTRVMYKYDIIPESSGSNPTYGTLQDSAISFSIQNPSAPMLVLPWSLNTALIGEPTNPGDILYLQFYAINDTSGETSLATEIQVTFTTIDDTAASAPAPTGIRIERSSVALKPSCAGVVTTGYSGTLLGYNFYVSTEQGGGAGGYALMNLDYVTDPDGTRNNLSQVSQVNSKTGNLLVTSTTSYEDIKEEFSYSLDGTTLSRLVGSGVLPAQNYDQTVPFYFTITASVYDDVLGVVVESPFSPEIEGRFISFSASYNELPSRTREDVVITLMQRIYALDKDINLMPGSVFKDMLDPISEEFEDYYIIQDFLAKTSSIQGLVQFDDENGDGVTDLVDNSVGKKRLQLALKLNNTGSVQGIINSFFEKYAGNFNVERLGATRARGKALLYTTSIPQAGLYIYDQATLSTGPGYGNGGEALKFAIQGSRIITYADRQTYYNPTENRYEVEVDIEAQSSGSLGNVAAGTIVQLIAGASSEFRVTNNSPCTGGTDTESNLALANRAQLAIAGVDSGREAGYAKTALGVSGVKSVRVEQAGDPLMYRDIDPSTDRHLGGKVDIYVQSDKPSQQQDIIAFSYDGPAGSGAGEQFFVEDAVNFRFRTTNPQVTAATPIFEVIRVTNATRGKDYDIAGAVVGLGDGDSIQLSQNSTNLSIGMATVDVLEVDYRYRGSNRYILDHQPVEEIISVTGDIDGTFPVENYSLVKLEDPLLTGNSTLASDGVEIVFFNGFPTNSTREITGEAHNFLSTSPIRLAKKGVDTDTLVVSADAEGISVYQKEVDYTVGKGGEKGYTYLYLEPFSKIRSGSVVYAAYSCSQNIKVVYKTNYALEEVQNQVNTMSHATADVAVKQSIQNYVDISLQVIRSRGTSATTIANKIKTTLGNTINNLKVGESLMLDDVIAQVKAIEGVKTLVLPVLRMMKKNDSYIPNDYLGFVNFRAYNQNASKGVTSYISINPVLNYGTVDGGGPSNRFRAIYQGEKSLVMAETPLDVSTALGRGYIQADGRIIVSTTDGTPPQTKEYRAAYFTYVAPEDEYAADILVDQVENLAVDSSSIEVNADTEETLTR